MQPTVTNRVAWSVGLSVHLLHQWAVQKMDEPVQNSRCCFGWRFSWAQETVAFEVVIGNLLGHASQRALQYNRNIQYTEFRLWAGPIVRWLVGRLRGRGTSLDVHHVCSILNDRCLWTSLAVNVLNGVHIAHGKGQFWGKRAPIVKYRDFLPWAVQKRLNWSISHLDCGLGWAQWSTSSVVFARLRKCASAMSCVKMAEPFDFPFGLWTQVGLRKHKFHRIRQVAPRQRALMGGHIGATWRIWWNCLSAVAMLLYAKLLWPLVTIVIIIF